MKLANDKALPRKRTSKDKAKTMYSFKMGYDPDASQLLVDHQRRKVPKFFPDTHYTFPKTELLFINSVIIWSEKRTPHKTYFA